jgi:hypothetical protein
LRRAGGAWIFRDVEVGHRKKEVDVDIISFISGMCPTRTRVEGERRASASGVTVWPESIMASPSGIPYL